MKIVMKIVMKKRRRSRFHIMSFKMFSNEINLIK